MKFDVPRISRDVTAVEQSDALIGTCRCGARWTGEAVCHCPTCHLTFKSVTGFDKHRLAGECRTADEMRACGYEPDANGHWRRPRPEDSLPVADGTD